VLQCVKFTAVNRENMVVYFDICWCSEPVSCVDFGLNSVTYLSRIGKAFGVMMELAGSCGMFRDDVLDCTVSTRKSRIHTVQLQVLMAVCVEVVVVVFGRWVTVHSSMQFARRRALGRMIQS
jgi:hypothetical protein